MDIPQVGRIAVLADPQGAEFAIFTPSMPGAGSDEPSRGDFSWHELATADWKAAWEFYRALFGWEFATSFDMGPMGTYWMFRRGGGTRMLGGMYTKGADMPGPPHWLPYVNVPSADDAARAATRHGGKVLHGPMEVPGGDRVAMMLDPQGALFAVHALATAAKPTLKTKKKTKTRKAPARKRAAAQRVSRRPAKAKRATAAKRRRAGRKPARASARRRPGAKKK
jgi:predicted enzyme related to lactoylglutathione lyase